MVGRELPQTLSKFCPYPSVRVEWPAEKESKTVSCVRASCGCIYIYMHRVMIRFCRLPKRFRAEAL